jgi:hypothetical protein
MYRIEKCSVLFDAGALLNHKSYYYAVVSAGAFAMEEVEISSAPAFSKISLARSFTATDDKTLIAVEITGQVLPR